jgi:hypothetical protein
VGDLSDFCTNPNCGLCHPDRKQIAALDRALLEEREALRGALSALWGYVQANCGDWYLRSDRRSIATRVEVALGRQASGKLGA